LLAREPARGLRGPDPFAMNTLPKDFERPSIPSAYLALWLTMLERRGHSAARLLAGTGLSQGELSRPDGMVSGRQLLTVVATSIQLTADPSLAYAFGLEMKPTSHGLLGYAIMTCATLRDAIRLGERYLRLRVAEGRIRIKLSVEGETAMVTLEDEIEFKPFRQFILEIFTAAILRNGEVLLGQRPAGEIWVDYPEPWYYAGLRDRLPPVKFGMPHTGIRFPSSYLDRPLALSDPLASTQAVARLEHELMLVSGEQAGVLERVRAALTDPERPFPELPHVAKRLGMSERTLKRRLNLAGTSYQRLLDEERRDEAGRLLQDGTLTIDDIAARLGYNDPANFTRAFRKWTGYSPTAWRRKHAPQDG
jgi:AraC-like DNA-binding protein